MPTNSNTKTHWNPTTPTAFATTVQPLGNLFQDMGFHHVAALRLCLERYACGPENGLFGKGSCHTQLSSAVQLFTSLESRPINA